MFESKAKVENLMNLVMQLRKVCNHPELFERRPARSPFSFQEQYYYTGYIPIRAGDIKLLSSSHRNPIYFGYPVLIHDEMVRFNESRSQTAKRLVNIYSVSNQRNN
jgi:DNA helicase INO80